MPNPDLDPFERALAIYAKAQAHNASTFALRTYASNAMGVGLGLGLSHAAIHAAIRRVNSQARCAQ